MPFIPDLFVTPHAIEQFQQRIAPMAAARVRDFILEGIYRANNVHVLPDETTLRIRTEPPFPFQFRAFVVFDEERGRPVVTTVVRGDSNVARKRKRKATRDARSHGGAAPEPDDSTPEVEPDEH
jgi:hypothetical protein